MSTPRPVVENADYAQFLARILRAMARRAATDIDALPMLAGAADEVDALLVEAVARCRADGYSWAEIGKRLGVTRQTAHERFAGRVSGRP